MYNHESYPGKSSLSIVGDSAIPIDTDGTANEHAANKAEASDFYSAEEAEYSGHVSASHIRIHGGKICAIAPRDCVLQKLRSKNKKKF